LGSRITVTSFLTEEATESMSQDKIKGCISASVNVEYFGSKGAVSAEGCSSKDGTNFNSRKNIVDKVVKTSYGTLVRSSGKFGQDDIKDPMPIKFTLAKLDNLFTPSILGKNGIPKPDETSTKILTWLRPMFDDLQKYYCEAFKDELPNCGKLTSKGCGYTDNCALGEGCIDLDTNKGTFKCVVKCPWGKGKGHGGIGAVQVGDQTGLECVSECSRRSQNHPSLGINGARVLKNGKKGCWCEKEMVASAKKDDGFKSCMFKKAEEYPLVLWKASQSSTYDGRCFAQALMAIDGDVGSGIVTENNKKGNWMAELKTPAIVTTVKVYLNPWAFKNGYYRNAIVGIFTGNKWVDCDEKITKNVKDYVSTIKCSVRTKATKVTVWNDQILYVSEVEAFGRVE